MMKEVIRELKKWLEHDQLYITVVKLGGVRDLRIEYDDNYNFVHCTEFDCIRKRFTALFGGRAQKRYRYRKNCHSEWHIYNVSTYWSNLMERLVNIVIKQPAHARTHTQGMTRCTKLLRHKSKLHKRHKITKMK